MYNYHGFFELIRIQKLRAESVFHDFDPGRSFPTHDLQFHLLPAPDVFALINDNFPDQFRSDPGRIQELICNRHVVF